MLEPFCLVNAGALHRQFPEIVFNLLGNSQMNKSLVLAAVITAAALAACGKTEEAPAPAPVAAPAPAAAPAAPAADASAAAAPAPDAPAAAASEPAKK